MFLNKEIWVFLKPIKTNKFIFILLKCIADKLDLYIITIYKVPQLDILGWHDPLHVLKPWLEAHNYAVLPHR